MIRSRQYHDFASFTAELRAIALVNERAVTVALAGMKLTRLIIAHRPETIAGAQRVVIVREGQVLELARAVPVAVAVGAAAPAELQA